MNHKGPGKYTLERFFAGELDEKAFEDVKAHLKSCVECAGYIRTLEDEKDIHLSRHPFRDFAKANIQTGAISLSDRIKEWFVKPVFYPIYGLALVLCLVVPVIIQKQNVQDNSYKGKSGLSFVFKRDGIINDGTTKELFQQGDQIQISYSYIKEHFATLLSIDSKGTVSTYQSQSGESNFSVQMKGGQSCIVPQSIILDNSSGEELVILLISNNTLSLNEVSSWAENLYNVNAILSDIEKSIYKKVPKNVIECRTLLLKKK
jgi:hypothetical protein